MHDTNKKLPSFERCHVVDISSEARNSVSRKLDETPTDLAAGRSTTLVSGLCAVIPFLPGSPVIQNIDNHKMFNSSGEEAANKRQRVSRAW